jgi:hypothetical protein
VRPLCLGLCIAATALPLQAQGRVRGILVDSLVSGKPLAGATVIVVGTTISRATDGRGRFQLDSVPVGKQLLTFFHSTLDSIGLGASMVEVDITDGVEADVTLGTPSGATLRRQLCPEITDTTTGLLLGKVRNVDTDEGLAEATVSTAWMELRFEGGPRPATFRESTKSLIDGTYVLCGVPLDVPVFVRASVGDQASGPVEVFGAARAVTFHHLAVSMTDTTARLSVDTRLEAMPLVTRQRPAGTATLIGRVMETGGRPIRGARVMLHIGGVATESDASGAFRLTGLPAGSQAIDIRAIGFTPTRRSVDLTSSDANEVTLLLDRRATPLPTVTVLGNARLERTGFFDRAKRGHGKFLTEQQINKMAGAMAIDVLWRAPGLIPRYFRSQGRSIRGVVMRRSGPGTCVPNLFLDGFNFPGAWDQLRDFLHKTEVVAVEVYTSTISLPAQFDRGGGCGAVVVWTRW